MNNLHLGWFLQDLNPGGGQRVCREISRILLRRGHRVRIVVPRGRAAVKIEGADVIEAGPPFANPMLSILASLPAMALAMGKVDVALSSMPFMGILNRFSPANLKYHYLQSDDYTLFDDRNLIRSKFLLALYKKSVKISYNLPLKFWFNSHWTKEKFQRLQKKETDYNIIPPGVNIDIFKPSANVIKNPELVGCFLKHGRIEGKKLAFNTMNLLAAKGHNLKLRIFSKDEIDFRGCNFDYEKLYLPHDHLLSEKLSQCSVLLGTSANEGFYLPALEAMACAVPLVMTDSGGCREYAVDGVNCLLTPQNDAQKLALSLTELMQNPQKAGKLAANGLKTASEFTWERTVDKIEEIIWEDMKSYEN